MKTLAIVGAAAVAAVASSSAASPLAAGGKLVFASAHPIPGQPSGDEIYSLDTGTGRIRDVSWSGGDETAPVPSPDGSRIAFARRSSTSTGALWLMRSDGSGKRRLASLDVLDYHRIQEIAWSPDGTRVAFSAAGPDGTDVLWAVDADGSGLRQLTDFFAHAPTWSPNGHEIAFSAGGDPTSGRIGVVAPDSTGLRWLTGPGDVSDTQPAWAPDGKRVAFVRTVGATCELSCGSSNLFVVDADGTGARQVTAYMPGVYPPIPLDAPAWSPNGRVLAFFKDGSGGHLDLIRADGTGLRTLAKHAFAPASWSPRGNRLAFGQQRGNLSGTRGYWRLTVQPLTGRPKRFALGSSSSPVLAGPYWSRAGKTLVFESVVTDTDFELFSAGPRGGGLRRLTHDRVDEFEPDWSPDGRRIAFVRGEIDRDSLRVKRGSLYVMSAAGRHVRRLTRGSLDTGPSWAPGGRRLAFVRDGDDLAALDLGTGRIDSLGVATDSEPGWSPDGGLIAFGQGTKLVVIRPNGTRERTLFDGGDNGVPAQIGRPSWSPDGRSIAFDLLYDHGRWTEESEVIVTRTGREVRRLLCYPPSPPFQPEYDHAGYRLAWSPDGQWLAVDGLSVCRIDGSGGYWLRPGVGPSWLAPRG